MKNNLQAKINQYEHLIEISRNLASTLDLSTLLRQIINVAAELTNAEAASILLYDDIKNQLYFQTATNIEDEPQLQGIIVPSESIAGWVAINREPLIVDDVHKESRYFNQVEQKTNYPTQSIIAVPMIAKEKLIGVLEVLNKLEGRFNDNDQENLMILGAQAAVAIENTRLFQQSDLISELVHELRTPLTSINTITYLLLQHNISAEERIRLSKTIQDETNRLSNMATQFLDFARLASGRVPYQWDKFDFGKLVVECIKFIETEAARYELKIVQKIPDELPVLTADRDKIKQVILNLMSNAIKYNAPQGTITVQVEANADWMIFSVKDTGIGIPAEDIPHLFEKFFRMKKTEKNTLGTGLGLSICKRIVENHAGEISVRSVVGSGSTFTVHLPISTTQST